MAPVIAPLLCIALTQPAHAALDLIPDGDYLLIHLVVLLVLIYPVNRLLLQPLAVVLREREARTSGARSQARLLAEEAADCGRSVEERLQAAHAEAQARRNIVLAEAEAEERRIVGEAREAGQHEIDSLREAVAQELVQARESLERDARGLAREAATRILGRAL